MCILFEEYFGSLTIIMSGGYMTQKELNQYVTHVLVREMIDEKEALVDSLFEDIANLMYIVDNPVCLEEMNELIGVVE